MGTDVGTEVTPETDTLDMTDMDMADLSDEDIARKLSESQAGDEDYDPSGDNPDKEVEEPAGDQSNDQSNSDNDTTGDQVTATEAVEGEVPPLILGKYKTIEDAEKGQRELEALLARQSQELGELRKRPAAVAAPTPAEEEITDEMINHAAYEELNLSKAMALYRSREKQSEAKANAEVNAEKAYETALFDAHERLSKEIDGFWDKENNVAGPTATAIRDYALRSGYTDEDLQRVAFDPVNGPKVIRSLYRDIKRDNEIEELKKKTSDEIAALKKEKIVNAGEIGKKIARTANSGPKIMGSGTGSEGKELDMPSNLSDGQIAEMTDEQLNTYIKRSRVA